MDNANKRNSPRLLAWRLPIGDWLGGNARQASPAMRWSIALTWGVGLAIWQSRHFFWAPSGQIFWNHDNSSYIIRLVEFADCLASGYWFPQWCADLRAGLGSPLFSYYPSGFFYVASLFYAVMPPVTALGAAVCVFSMIGFLGMMAMIGTRLGFAEGVVGATALLCFTYSATNLYCRGDLSEYAATMIVPTAAHFVLKVLERKSVGAAIASGAAWCGVIVTHPAAALIGILVTFLCAAALACAALSLRSVALLAASLLTASALSAFYWFPVFFEWDLVQTESAFVGHFAYSGHFVDLNSLSSPYQVPLHEAAAAVPVTIGVPFAVLCTVAVSVIACEWSRLSVAQRRMLGIAMASAALSVFLMTRFSAAIWERVGMLQRLQFPWRCLSILSVYLGALCTAAIVWLPRGKILAAVGVIVALWATARTYSHTEDFVGAVIPRTAAEIANEYYAPDVADEWLPRGAARLSKEIAREGVRCNAAARIDNFTRRQGALSVDIACETPSEGIVPHFYFPVGWNAILGDKVLPIQPTEEGLMRIAIPENSAGTLTVCFSMTPMRRVGLLVSSISLAACVIAMCLCAQLEKGAKMNQGVL